ncbi:MAG: tetratricopeptide repeat protein [Pseudomonadota bacterium]
MRWSPKWPFAVLTLIAALAAPAGAPMAQNGVAGPYLAALVADRNEDYSEAATQYLRALASDGSNPALLRRAVVAHVAKGSVEGAIPLARRLAETGRVDDIAPLVLFAAYIEDEDYAAALAVLDADGETLNPLLAGLLRGWVQFALGDAEGALAHLASLNQPEVVSLFATYHTALMQGLAGDLDGARETLEGGEDGPLRLNRGTIVARAMILSAGGDDAAAMAVLDEALDLGVEDGELEAMRASLAAGESLQFTRIRSAKDGVAEVFFNFADAVSDRPGRESLVHVRLATYLHPGFGEALILAAELLEDRRQYDLAILAYAGVPQSSPLFLSAERGRAIALRLDDRADEAIGVLTGLTRNFPDDWLVHYNLGDALRQEERFAEAVAAYTDAVRGLGTPTSRHWPLFYSRAISYERQGIWEPAEADFRRALELEEDQPLVLNYLGYSLVERREKLDEALEMIERAVAQRDEDGFIRDSLGWVLYRLGRFEEAVEPMERAVKLEPTDPVINDHLGDVYWKVGREREAVFQWSRALSFDPEEEDAERIRRKLEVGLDQVLAEEAAAAGDDDRPVENSDDGTGDGG